MSGISTLVGQLIAHRQSIQSIDAAQQASDYRVKKMIKDYVCANPGCRSRDIFTLASGDTTSLIIHRALRGLYKNNEVKVKNSNGYVYFPASKKVKT